MKNIVFIIYFFEFYFKRVVVVWDQSMYGHRATVVKMTIIAIVMDIQIVFIPFLLAVLLKMVNLNIFEIKTNVYANKLNFFKN